jgi:hypothetical protein
MPQDLWHVVLFYIAGEVTRQELAKVGVEYKPYLYAIGLFDRAWPRFRSPVETSVQPYRRQGHARADGHESRHRDPVTVQASVQAAAVNNRTQRKPLGACESPAPKLPLMSKIASSRDIANSQSGSRAAKLDYGTFTAIREKFRRAPWGQQRRLQGTAKMHATGGLKKFCTRCKDYLREKYCVIFLTGYSCICSRKGFHSQRR